MFKSNLNVIVDADGFRSTALTGRQHHVRPTLPATLLGGLAIYR